MTIGIVALGQYYTMALRYYGIGVIRYYITRAIR